MELTEKSHLTVEKANVTDDSIIVEFKTALTDYSFQNFSNIYLCKSEVDEPEIKCDYNKTATLNGYDIFKKELSSDKVFLAFTDDSIDSTANLSRYTIWFEIPDTNNKGVSHTQGMALE